MLPPAFFNSGYGTMPTAVLFDLDGTLVDSRADLATAVNLVRADFGLEPISVDRVVSYVGDGVRTLLARALADLPGADLTEAVARMRGHYLAHMLDETLPYPGVAEGLARLAAAGFVLGVVTNKVEEPARHICAALGLMPPLAAIVGGDTCPTLKPSPEPVHHALAQLGAGAEGGWFVGDNHTDLEAGAAAGLRTCFCRFGFGHADGRPADLEVDHFAELVAHLTGR